MTPPALSATHLLALPSLPSGRNAYLAIAALACTAFALLMGLRARHGQGPARHPQRRRSAAVVTAAVAALMCTAYSADTSWRFAAHYLGMRNTTERATMFAAAELALFAMALMARQNLHGPRRAAGLPGALVWVITTMQAIPAYAESGPVGGTMRAFTGPVMAAVLWHLAMGIELRQHTPDATSRGLAAVLMRQARERLLARLGIVEQDQGAAQIIRDRAMRRAVTLAARLAEMTPEQRSGRSGRRTLRHLSKALARSGIDTDPRRNEQLLRQLATRRQAAALATIDLAPRWTAPTSPAPSPPAARHNNRRAGAEERADSGGRAETGARPHPTDPGDEEPHRAARPQTARPNPTARSGPEPAARPEQSASTRTGNEPPTGNGSGAEPGRSPAGPKPTGRHRRDPSDLRLPPPRRDRTPVPRPLGGDRARERLHRLQRRRRSRCPRDQGRTQSRRPPLGPTAPPTTRSAITPYGDRMHDAHHALPTTQQEATPALNSGASCTGSNAPGVPAPQGAGAARRQGAPDRQAATEGGPQQGGNRTAEKPVRKRQRPRQPAHRKRLHQPSCRMNDTEFTRLTTAASHCKMSNAAFLAYAVDKAARDLTRTAAEIATEREVIDEIFAARRHLGRIHGLFNQVAKALNSGADAPHLHATAQAVHAAARRMEDAADALLAHRDGTAEGGAPA